MPISAELYVQKKSQNDLQHYLQKMYYLYTTISAELYSKNKSQNDWQHYLSLGQSYHQPLSYVNHLLDKLLCFKAEMTDNHEYNQGTY